MSQINAAMGQLNQTTQQNASASEQLAATAEEMSGQAEQLQQLMSFFKISANGGGDPGFRAPERKARAQSGARPASRRAASAQTDTDASHYSRY